MKRNKENKIIEIAISDYTTTSFAVKLEMLAQEKIDKKRSDAMDILMFQKQEQNERQIEKLIHAEKSGSKL